YDRIGEEVDEDLPEAHRVGRDRHRLSRSSRETDVYVPLARQRADQFDGVEHDLFYEHRPRVDGDATLADGGQVERLFDEAKKVMSRSRDLLRRFPDLAVLPGLQQLRPAQDRVEGGPQLVAHAGEELVPVAARPLRRLQRLDPLGHLPAGHGPAAEGALRPQPPIAWRGVRSSWLMREWNSSRSRPARSAASSASIRSVTSRKVMSTPRRSGSASKFLAIASRCRHSPFPRRNR